MISKHENSNTAPKTFWTILDRFSYNKTIPPIPPLLFQTIVKKANFFKNFFASIKNNEGQTKIYY